MRRFPSQLPNDNAAEGTQRAATLRWRDVLRRGDWVLLAFRLAGATLDNAATHPRLHVHGASSLGEESVAAHDVPMETLRAVLAMLEEKHRLIRLLNEYIEGPGLTVVIGGEHVSPDLRSFSLVASTAPGGTVVGVLGPRRMRYARAITAVDGLSRILGRVLAGERN